MKTILLVIIIMTSILNAEETEGTKSCCSTAPEKFSNFSKDKQFAPSHNVPIAFNFHSEVGKMIDINLEEKKPAKAFMISGNSDKYVFVIHEWWGLNNHIKKEAENIFRDLGGEINVIALDLYDGKVATTREDARNYMQEATKDMNRLLSIFNSAIQMVKTKSDKATIATIGWCFGGGMSMQLAIEAAENASACVIYYGMPEENMQRLKNLEADVLGIFATQDKWINPGVVKEFENRMNATNKNLELHSYEANHAFANPSNPGHKPKMAKDAHKKAIKFILEKL
ncbi:dienelactone hydrolase family protein [Candidatus Kapabacteria bacterium]|nr:dienelactone hydrolase family protein [Candidatus Kapabacteria bacterium]